MNILLVEDDPVSLAYFESVLTGMGHAVHPAGDGESAWAAFLAGEFQLVISDWSLPGLSGAELCSRIRERKAREYVYFILIAADQGRVRFEEAMSHGVDDFLGKPVDIGALAVRLRVAERILTFHREIRKLKELVPLCMYCKKVRNDQQFWENVETYIRTETGAGVTHSLCPECRASVVQPQLDALRAEQEGPPPGPAPEAPGR